MLVSIICINVNMSLKIKDFFRKLLRSSGFSVQRIKKPVELTDDEFDIIKLILDDSLSMCSIERLISTALACKYIIKNNIRGDFVECGTWRGGNAILAKYIFNKYEHSNIIHIFDTFCGMTEPSKEDFQISNAKPASDYYDQKKELNEGWCSASINDVKNNFIKITNDLRGVNFIEGDILKTVPQFCTSISDIAILRLDTDWYDSTSHELFHFYPKVVKGGIVLIDDYDAWDGCRKAVDEYIQNLSYTFLNFVDFGGGRNFIKL